MAKENKKTVTVGLEKVLLKSEREEKRQKTKHRVLIILLCVLFLIIGFGGGVLFVYQVHPTNKADSTNTLGEIEALMENYWIYSNEYENLETLLEDKAFYGMTRFDEDPYTTYMSNAELDEFASSINMDFVGIGVVYSTASGKAVIQRVIKDSPAEKVKLQAGDIIEKVDGISIDNLSSSEIKELVLGEIGTEVVITITRNNTSFDVSVIRDEVDNTVYCYAQDDYVVMELSSFGNATGKDCMSYLDEYTDYSKLIIDIRNNTGGYQTSVKEIAGLFIGDGQVYLRQKDVNGLEAYDLTQCSKTYTNFNKIIILINGETASAAEVFAICLKEELPYVTLVGETTYGKGVIQTTRSLLNGGVLKFTSYYWYSPNGESINNVGIKPDVEVKLDDIAYEYYSKLDDDENYKYDSVNESVRISEMALKFLGYNINRTDGYFDESFELALNEYKANNNMDMDGTLDNDTYQAIMSSVVLGLADASKDYQMLKAIDLLKD